MNPHLSMADWLVVLAMLTTNGTVVCFWIKDVRDERKW